MRGTALTCPRAPRSSSARSDTCNFCVYCSSLLEHSGDFLDPGLDAGLVLLRARRADGFVANLDRQRALVCNHVAEVDQAERGVGLEARLQVARGDAEGAR